MGLGGPASTCLALPPAKHNHPAVDTVADFQKGREGREGRSSKGARSRRPTGPQPTVGAEAGLLSGHPERCGVGGDPFLCEKLCRGWKLAEKRPSVCSETSGRECQNFGGRARETRRRAPGTEGRTYDSAGRRARGSALPLLLRPGPRGRQPGLPVHMPQRRGGRERRAGAAAPGGGTPPAVRRAVGRDSQPPRVRAPPRAAVAGGELGSGRAAPSAGPGRSLHSALCPRRAAGSRPSAVLCSDSRAPAPARPALPLRDPRLGSVPTHGLGD
ncbi:unnamed protein product [Rangifer tarandus platyrhynchus]|uniref:Uncharacterized protein n=1 Tax=Rangifer tarandus platyrhynchus TaxID=3082113 RepID=A0ABN9A097_RANTA|nr:unnamed protein product [Rangifer tarandus platyrhynchus]